MSKNESKVSCTIRVCQTDLDVTVPVREKQNYLKAAEYLTQRIDACAKVYASTKPLITIMLLVMLDMAYKSMKQQHKRGIRGIWKRMFNKKEI